MLNFHQKGGKVETIEILRQLSKSSNSLGELKGIAKTIPNQEMLINAVVLQEAKTNPDILMAAINAGIKSLPSN